MVEPPPVIPPARKLLAALRTMPCGSNPGFVQNVRSSIATVPWTTFGEIWWRPTLTRRLPCCWSPWMPTSARSWPFRSRIIVSPRNWVESMLRTGGRLSQKDTAYTLPPTRTTARRAPTTPTRRTKVRRVLTLLAGDQLGWNRARGRRPELILILGGSICSPVEDVIERASLCPVTTRARWTWIRTGRDECPFHMGPRSLSSRGWEWASPTPSPPRSGGGEGSRARVAGASPLRSVGLDHPQ